MEVWETFFIVDKFKQWSVEFHSKPYDNPDGISPTQWYAELKDAQGKSKEKRDIFQYSEEKTTDKILTEKSGYSPIWDVVNIEFKKFQIEHRRIKNKENKMRQNAEVVSAMKRVESFLEKKEINNFNVFVASSCQWNIFL